MCLGINEVCLGINGVCLGINIEWRGERKGLCFMMVWKGVEVGLGLGCGFFVVERCVGLARMRGQRNGTTWSNDHHAYYPVGSDNPPG